LSSNVTNDEPFRKRSEERNGDTGKGGGAHFFQENPRPVKGGSKTGIPAEHTEKRRILKGGARKKVG